MKPRITLVVTSCGRFDLLERTLVTFFKFNTYPIYKTIIIEDSGIKLSKRTISKFIDGNFEIIQNEKNLGQIRSIDLLYSRIKSEYFFHCEDDWEFYRSNFIEDSLAIMEQDSSIFTVFLRAHNDTNGHPIGEFVKFKNNPKARLIMRNYNQIWHGFTFNPGLRRLKDYKRLSPYADLCIFHKRLNKTIVAEEDLSYYYDREGYRSVITLNSTGYVKHTGDHAHIFLEWESFLFFRFYLKLKLLMKEFLNKFYSR